MKDMTPNAALWGLLNMLGCGCSGLILLPLALTLGCSDGNASSDDGNNGKGDESRPDTDADGTDAGDSAAGADGAAGSYSATSTGDEVDISDACATYDASDNSYRLDDGAGWISESDDGCYIDKFSTWAEWECEPGTLTNTFLKFWATDTIPSDDPEFDRNNFETIVNASDGTLEMGMFMLSKFPVVVSSVDVLMEYPAELLKFSRIERHWVSITRDEPPSRHINVEVVEPGVLSFIWDMECLPRVVHKGDIPMATIYFDILATGEGPMAFTKADGETWSLVGDHTNVWKLHSEVTEPRPSWVTMVDGTEGPVRAVWDNHVVIR